jgi:proline iminopeptidase
MIGKNIQIREKGLYVEDYGRIDSPVLLYLHGGPGESCFDFTFHQKERLEEHFRVIAIDQRGVCRSELIQDEEEFGLMDLIEDCEALRKYLNISKWSVLGHSFGGYLTLLYASTYPNSIERVIFECATFDFNLTSRFLLKKTAKIAEKYKMNELANKCLALAENEEKTVQQLTEEYMDLSDKLGKNRMEIYRYNQDVQTDYDFAYSEAEWDKFYDRSEVHYNRLRAEGKIFESLIPKLVEIKLPMLLMTADYDPATCDKHIEAFVKYAANGEIYHFTKCGHTPHYEVPDHFTQVVKEYLLK